MPGTRGTRANSSPALRAYCPNIYTVPQGYVVNFTFLQFDFEKYENVGNENECDGNYDWLKFIDGNDASDKTITFCRKGTKALNRTFTSETNDITLWMYSDDAASGKGKKVYFVNISNRTEKAFSLQAYPMKGVSHCYLTRLNL